jgi:hypothetical protein
MVMQTHHTSRRLQSRATCCRRTRVWLLSCVTNRTITSTARRCRDRSKRCAARACSSVVTCVMRDLQRAAVRRLVRSGTATMSQSAADARVRLPLHVVDAARTHLGHRYVHSAARSRSRVSQHHWHAICGCWWLPIRQHVLVACVGDRNR